jgi:putative tryptophan/tyrosine transport system substrate-binding protein
MRSGRREFIAGLGAAAAWLLAARAQQPKMPVVGILDGGGLWSSQPEVYRAFRQGLKEAGFVEGENVAFEYRSGENIPERMRLLAADLVRQRVTVIVAPAQTAAFAAKATTTTIPIVFVAGEDPVRLGLVASLARPERNVTGVNFFVTELVAKRLEILRELMPSAKRIAALVDPQGGGGTESALRELESVARSMQLQIQIHHASTSHEIDAAFVAMARERPDALIVASGPFVTSRRVQLAILAGRLGVPAIYANRLLVEAGGLMSYGASLTDAMRQMAIYAGRIIKGATPGDLPVVQSSKYELVINAQTARIFGLTVPPTLLAGADEVIE